MRSFALNECVRAESFRARLSGSARRLYLLKFNLHVPARVLQKKKR